jgi:asparagine synthase (glutamine-hydrolysing)
MWRVSIPRSRSRPIPAISPVARRVRDGRLTYLKDEKLVRIEQAIEDVSRSSVQGCFVECGVALGGSGIIIATLMPEGRAFHGYDVFGMIPPPTSEKDDEKSKARYETIRSGQSQGSGGDPYYGYVDNLYDRVVENFEHFGQPVDGRRVSLYKGYFEDTLDPPTDIAFAHIDCDWYDPVKLCLERIARASPPVPTSSWTTTTTTMDAGVRSTNSWEPIPMWTSLPASRTSCFGSGPEQGLLARLRGGPAFT